MTLWQELEPYVDEQLSYGSKALISDEVEQYLKDLTPLDIKAIVTTPGGRVGNDSPFSRSRTDNWVARAGGLPRYIRIVAHGLVKKGKTESEAIRLAIGIIKNWAEGKGNVSAKVRAAAAKAYAEFLAKAKGSRAAGAAKRVARTGRSGNNSKGSDVGIQHKDSENKDLEYSVKSVKGITVEDEEQGIVSAIVSVTGIEDNVKDNILPGAYEKTLVQRKPKGVWGHDWLTPVSKTIDAKELRPGDPELPKTQRNGEPWPADAGALKVTTQFNRKTDVGERAYQNVIFFGDDQEWSIGYQVPPGGATVDQKTGVRNIHTLNLYEYSPVLFGAMPLACTTDVKTAQLSYKHLFSAGELTPEIKDLFAGAEIEAKRAVSTDDRKKLADTGKAMPDGSYPIANTSDLKNAIQAVGRAKNPDAVKKHIKKRAKALKAENLLPDDWKDNSQKSDVFEDDWGNKDDSVDVTPYADPDTDYDDDDDDDSDTDDTSSMTVELSAMDLQYIADVRDELGNLYDLLAAKVGGNLDPDDDDDQDAVSEDDMTTKSFYDEMDGREPVTRELKSDEGETAEGDLTAIVDSLGEYQDEIGNLGDLQRLAGDFDDEVAEGDMDSAISTAQNFRDALGVAYGTTEDDDALNALNNVTEQFAELIQSSDDDEDEGDDQDDQDDDEDDDSGDDTDDSDSGDQEGAEDRELAGAGAKGDQIALFEVKDLEDLGISIS